MTHTDKFVLPISQLIGKADWPRDFFGPPRHFSPLGAGLDDDMDTWLDELFDQVYFNDYRAIEGSGAFGFHINFW